MPAPRLMVLEYATCICAAMKAPEDRPDTETSLTLTLYLGSTTALDAIGATEHASRQAYRPARAGVRRSSMLSPGIFFGMNAETRNGTTLLQGDVDRPSRPTKDMPDQGIVKRRRLVRNSRVRLRDCCLHPLHQHFGRPLAHHQHQF